MFDGSLSFEGAPITENLVTLLGFLTVVLSLAQDEQYSIPILDMIQTFLCWPTILEGFCVGFCLWSFRHIERLLGTKSYIFYMLYNFLSFLPVFLLTLKIKGFKTHFSFLFFIPFSLFVFMIWRVPSVVYSGPLTDKFVVCLPVMIVFILRFPYSVFTLLSSIFGYYFWSHDTFKMKKIALRFSNINISQNNTNTISNRTLEQPLQQQQQQNSNGFEQLPLLASAPAFDQQEDEENPKVAQIISMGFSEEDSKKALQINGGDVNRAVDYLLNH